MTTFTKEELLHIANLSGLPLAEHELDQFRQQINAILTYVDQLQTVKLGQEAAGVRNVNVLRDDRAERKDSAAILAQAPETDDGYFVVPKILDEK